MIERQPPDPREARRFRTGRPCLDFSHTGGDGPLAVFELLHDVDDAAWWIGVILGTDVVADDATSLDEVIALRRSTWNSARGLARGAALRAADCEVISAAATPPTPIPRLTEDGRSVPAATVMLPAALSLLARDAIDLFSGPLSGRIRSCSAPDCGLLFVDQSRPGTRRWCSMQRCGNLAKVRRFRRADTAPDTAPGG